MTRTFKRTVLAATAIAGVAGLMTAAPRTDGPTLGTGPGIPEHQERRVAVLHRRRQGLALLPLDQINGSNFNQLEVAWRFKTDNLGTRPEFKLEGTPLMVKGVIYATGGTRRSVVALDAQDRRADLGARREGRRARRQRAAPALGPRPLLLDRRQG